MSCRAWWRKSALASWLWMGWDVCWCGFRERNRSRASWWKDWTANKWKAGPDASLRPFAANWGEMLVCKLYRVCEYRVKCPYFSGFKARGYPDIDHSKNELDRPRYSFLHYELMKGK